MKNKQFSVLNNNGSHKQRHLCKMHKCVIAVLSSLTMLFTTSAVFPDNTFNLVGGITASAEETEYIVGHYMDFEKEASEGNWKENATLDEDGYTWDANSLTLTLGNIQISKNIAEKSLNFPTYKKITIVIAEGAEPILLGGIRRGSPLTITGKGTITANAIIINGETELTITGGAEVISGKISGDIKINEGGKLNVSGNINTSRITMDETAVLEINADTEISFDIDNNLEESLKAIMPYFPSGYKLEKYKDEYISYNIYFIIPDNASVKYTLDEDGNWTYFPQYEDGTPVKERVLIKYSPHDDNIGEHLAGHSISLDGNIGVNFYMELDKSVIDDENAYMQFTLPNDKTSTVKVSEADKKTVDGKEYYVFSCKVAPKEIYDIITAQIITSDGIKGKLYEYSVKEYADYITSHSNDYYDDTINLVRAMMNYGNSAKAYFSNSETDDISEVTADNLKNFEKQISGTLPEGIEYYGSSLLLESETTVRHYFKAKEGTDVSKYDFKEKNSYYYTDIPNISAGQLGTAKVTTIGNWSISYSPMSYAYDVLNSNTASDNLKNLIKALYLYNQAAEAYQNGGK